MVAVSASLIAGLIIGAVGPQIVEGLFDLGKAGIQAGGAIAAAKTLGDAVASARQNASHQSTNLNSAWALRGPIRDAPSGNSKWAIRV